MNPLRESTKFTSNPKPTHVTHMHRICTPKRGTFIQPKKFRDGEIDFVLEIIGSSDSNMAKDPDSRKSVSGWVIYLNGAVLTVKSKQSETVALSVTKAEINVGASCAQDMMFIKCVLELMGLRVKTPMRLKADNSAMK